MNTHDLLRSLSATRDFDRFCKRADGEFTQNGFGKHLQSLLDARGMTVRDLVERSNMDKSYLYQILREIRLPSRDKTLQLALGLGCTLEETQRLLRVAGRGELYPRIRRDAAIIFCIHRRMSRLETQEFLSGYELELLED